MKKIITLAILIVFTASTWLLAVQYDYQMLNKVFNTFLAFTILYAVLKIFLQEVAIKRIRDSKTRYSLQRTISIVFLLIGLFITIGIWVENPQTLLVSYGLLAAGLAVALQDVFKNFAGAIIIITNNLFSVGDRIEINGKQGDVIDIGILYTTLLEIGDWVPADQATGRLMTIPNGFVLNTEVKNYTKDHGFIWDEIVIPISYGSDWQKAKKVILAIVKKETKPILEKANKGLDRLSKKYFFEGRPVEPDIYIKVTDNWIRFDVRYVVETQDRRTMYNILSQKILAELEKTRGVEIASSTIEISSWPAVNLKK